jgi:hypothetical protein
VRLYAVMVLKCSLDLWHRSPKVYQQSIARVSTVTRVCAVRARNHATIVPEPAELMLGHSLDYAVSSSYQDSFGIRIELGFAP